VAFAGCILPLTLRQDLPEGMGTRHRAAVGITEESDAVVIVVSEETASISVVVGGQMSRDLDAPQLRITLRDVLTGQRRETPDEDEEPSAARVEAGSAG
jgi:diadenylate cyclase